jgi:hypothetical protein
MPTVDTANLIQTFASTALPTAVKEIVVYSAFSPPVVINVQEALTPVPTTAPPTATQRLLGVVKPAVTMRGGNLGTQTVAPYGSPNPNAWKLNLALMIGGALLVGGAAGAALVAAGRVSKRR